MRTLLAALRRLILPGSGKCRRTPVPADSSPVVLSAPRIAVERRRPINTFDVLTVDDMQVVRPYVLLHEREQERQRQPERRTDLLMAAAGCDHPGAGVAV